MARKHNRKSKKIIACSEYGRKLASDSGKKASNEIAVNKQLLEKNAMLIMDHDPDLTTWHHCIDCAIRYALGSYPPGHKGEIRYDFKRGQLARETLRGTWHRGSRSKHAPVVQPTGKALRPRLHYVGRYRVKKFSTNQSLSTRLIRCSVSGFSDVRFARFWNPGHTKGRVNKGSKPFYENNRVFSGDFFPNGKPILIHLPDGVDLRKPQFNIEKDLKRDAKGKIEMSGFDADALKKYRLRLFKSFNSIPQQGDIVYKESELNKKALILAKHPHVAQFLLWKHFDTDIISRYLELRQKGFNMMESMNYALTT